MTVRRKTTLTLAAPAILIGGMIAAQELPSDLSSTFPFSHVSTPTDPDAFRLNATSDLVMLDVSVKDLKGGFVSGLTKDKFKIFDDGKEAPLTVFRSGDIPVTVGLVVDNSGSMRAKRPEVVTAALTFVTESNPDDELFVVNFNDRVSLGLPRGKPFTADKELLRTALLRNPVQGRTALDDALKLALEHLDDGHKDRKTLVLISDGGDNASDVTEKEIVRLAEEKRVTIYTVGIYDDDDQDKNPRFLQRLAQVTGGECYLPKKLDEMVAVCSKIAKDIRSRYVVGFSPEESAMTDRVRKLRVVAEPPQGIQKVVVKGRTSYIAAKRAPTHQHTEAEDRPRSGKPQ
jgi:Ca-activated chloride channel family protein